MMASAPSSQQQQPPQEFQTTPQHTAQAGGNKVPAGAPGSASKAAAASSAAKSLLHSAETHLRIMAYNNEFDVKNGNGGAGNQHQHVVFPKQQPQVECDVSRVHPKETDTKSFFDDVIGPCVRNAVSGQSYTIAFVAPPSSGRSLTLYGANGEKGVLELTARELRTNHSNVVATYSSFVTSGSSIQEARHGNEPVRVQDYPPPLGPVALAKMTPVDDPAQCAALPTVKLPGGSTFIQFQLYNPLDNTSTRHAFATLTFVDVAAFSSPMPADLQCLIHSVERATEGRDPQFNQCKLTELLGPAIQGPQTLMCVATCVGKPDLAKYTAATLGFLSKVRKVDQVLTLINLVTPKWLVDATSGTVRRQEGVSHHVKEEYQRGVSDFFSSCSKFLTENMTCSESVFDRLVENTEDAREKLAQQIQTQLDNLGATLRTEEDSRELGLREAKSAQQSTEEQLQIISNLDKDVETLEHQVKSIDQRAKSQVAKYRLRMGEMEMEGNKRQRECDKHEKDAAVLQTRIREAASAIDKECEEVIFDHQITKLQFEMAEQTQKKQRLEEYLHQASERAKVKYTMARKDRERKSKLSTVAFAEKRVNVFRNKLHHNNNQQQHTGDGLTTSPEYEHHHQQEPNCFADPNASTPENWGPLPSGVSRGTCGLGGAGGMKLFEDGNVGCSSSQQQNQAGDDDQLAYEHHNTSASPNRKKKKKTGVKAPGGRQQPTIAMMSPKPDADDGEGFA